MSIETKYKGHHSNKGGVPFFMSIHSNGNKVRGLEELRHFLLHNQIEINKLLRQDTKDWEQILSLAHDQAVAAQKLADIACDEAHKLEIDENMRQNNPASASLIFLDMSQLEHVTKNESAISEFLAKMPH